MQNGTSPRGEIRIAKMYVGRVQPLGPKGVPSAIAKEAVPGPWRVTRTGLAGDTQGDKVHHGGPEKALHHYPYEHYAAWRQEHPELAPALAGVPAFGENLSTLGVTEDTVHIGDIWRLGGVLIQVSQGRQPCWKLNFRFGLPNMARLVQATGWTGWYYRVLAEGLVEEGDPLVLVERPQPGWPLSRVTELLYKRPRAFGELAELAQVPELAPSWRELAARRAQTQEVESWEKRLTGA